MSEATVLDPASVSEPAISPASDVDLLAPEGAAVIAGPGSEGQESVAGPGGGEEGEEPKEEAPARDTPEYYAAIQAKVDAREPLTSEERSDWQSMTDRAAAKQQARRLTQQTRQQYETLARGFTPGLVESARAALNLGRDEDLNDSERLALIQLSQGLGEKAAAFIDQTEPLILFSHEVQLRDAIARLDPKTAAATLADLDASTKPVERFARTLAAYGDARARLAAEQSDMGKRAAKAEAERDRLKVEIEKLKGSRATGNGAGTNGKAADPARGVTYAQILKMSESDLKALPDDVFEAAIQAG